MEVVHGPAANGGEADLVHGASEIKNHVLQWRYIASVVLFDYLDDVPSSFLSGPLKKCLATNGADMILRHWLRHIVARILDH